MTGPKIRVHDVRRLHEGRLGEPEADQLAVEEPLEIRVNGRPLAVIMRTPGDDEALAAGFLITEGIVEDAAQILSISPGGEADATKGNVAEVALAPGVALDEARLARNFYVSSSCGVCGKASIEAVVVHARPLRGDWQVAPAVVLDFSRRLRERQAVFARTGSLHAAGLFTLEGELLEIAEDVGRHNAVDKIIGRAALAGRPRFGEAMLFVSGRISFEIAQKALVAGIPFVAAVSGASSLAVALVEDQAMTLVGFVRDASMTVYHGAWRIKNA